MIFVYANRPLGQILKWIDDDECFLPVLAHLEKMPGAWSSKFDPRFRNEEHQKENNIYDFNFLNIGIYPAMNNYQVLRVATAHNLSNEMK